MPEAVLTILKLCLLALLYLFFLRVLRAVWSEVREPAAAPAVTSSRRDARRARSAAPPAPPAPVSASPAATPARRSKGRGSRSAKAPRELVVMAPESLAGITAKLGDELTIGRGSDSTIVVEDSYVSQTHTRVTRRDGRFFVEDLGSTNGTYLNRERVTAPTIVHRGDHLQLGNVVVEIR